MKKEIYVISWMQKILSIQSTHELFHIFGLLIVSLNSIITSYVRFCDIYLFQYMNHIKGKLINLVFCKCQFSLS